MPEPAGACNAQRRTTGGVSGQADLHYALPFVQALLALTAPPERRSVPLALLLLCFAANFAGFAETI